ncbi:NPCBM/NEW2 domain-containing protein [Prosthecobacter sp.]|uniref:NPCBM/NEW2 domain-containing protein n=1 Tax=Prosthecobacter sp. TaxID=1965333 RepID=UPI0037850CB2
MIRLLFPLLCLSTFAAAQLKELLPGEPTREDLGRAKGMLEKWENDAPEEARRVMRICYWSPADREPQPEYRARLTRVLKHVQDFYRREMASWGFPERTIQLELETDGLLKLHVVQGRLKSEECSESDQKDGREIKQDCLKVLRETGIDGAQETMVIFCNLADWDSEKRTMGHHSPYYASGDSAHGTAWQVDSPLLDADSLAVKDQMIQDKQYGKISLGKYNSIFIGGVCHEIGHALGLPHCKECAAARRLRGTALMGSGNRTYGEELRGEGRGSFLSLSHALKLAAHPQFSGSVKQMGTKAKATFAGWKLEPRAEGLAVSGSVQANLPVHAVLAYADPAGGGDYDSQIAVAVPGEGGRFSLLLQRSEKKDTSVSLHVVAVCVNGAATASVWSEQAVTMNGRITAESAYDVSKAVQKMELDAQWPAFSAGKLSEQEMAKLSPEVQGILRRLRAADNAKGKTSPAEAEGKVLVLSDAKPLHAETGWAGVHFDRTPEGGPLQGPEGLFEQGLYAHANSVYEYELGGRWDSFTGSACVLQGGFGKVEATIWGDGRELWKSKVLKAGDLAAFDVEVRGVKKLTLRIEGKDGINGAWGAWGETVLRRGGK